MGSISSAGSAVRNLIPRVRGNVENLRDIPYGSNVGTLVHMGVGMGLASALVFGPLPFLPSRGEAAPGQLDDRDWLEARYFTSAAAFGLLAMTVGAQHNTGPGRVPNAGINPVYMMAVGGLAGAYFVGGRYAQNLER